MTLIKALKLNKPLRRIGVSRHAGSEANGWIGSEYLKSFLLHKNGPMLMGNIFLEEDLMADDWEVKPDESEYIIHYYLEMGAFEYTPKGAIPSIRLIDERLVEKLVTHINKYALGYEPGETYELMKEYRKFVPKR